MAERIAIRNFYSGIVVISGEGVKEYYSKRGYQEVDTFMVKNFYDINKFINMIYIIINISYILWAAFVLYSA
jgi:hypothetical protein